MSILLYMHLFHLSTFFLWKKYVLCGICMCVHTHECTCFCACMPMYVHGACMLVWVYTCMSACIRVYTVHECLCEYTYLQRMLGVLLLLDSLPSSFEIELSLNLQRGWGVEASKLLSFFFALLDSKGASGLLCMSSTQLSTWALGTMLRAPCLSDMRSYPQSSLFSCLLLWGLSFVNV